MKNKFLFGMLVLLMLLHNKSISQEYEFTKQDTLRGSYKSNSGFGKLVALSVGLPIILQALINMGVAVQLFPVTGQPLPLISMGGTSIWTTFLALGILLSVSNKDLNNETKVYE